MSVLARLGLMAGLLALAGAPAQAQEAHAPGAASNLVIRIENVSARGGMVRLGLYTRAAYPNDKSEPIAAADVPARAGETIITLKAIPPGVYAVETFQDINANGKMDTSWIGLPLEPFGFSRDARPFLSKPDFDDVKVTLVPGENHLTVHLQNFMFWAPRK
jgi:uncharacterized protein (DUF2141 family)